MKNKCKNQFWRIPIFIIVIAIIIYGIVFISLGYIPSINKIILFENEADVFWNLPLALNLPFAISRLWDLALIFIASCLVFRLVSYVSNKDENLFFDSSLFGDSNSVILLIMALAFGFLLGLIIGFGIYFFPAIIIGLAISFLLGIGIGLLFGRFYSLGVGFISSLVIGFVFGFLANLIIGLALDRLVLFGGGFGIGFGVGLVVGILLGLVINLILLLQDSFQENYREKPGKYCSIE